MPIHTLKEILFHGTPVTQSEDKVGTADIGRAFGVMRTTTISPERRCERRRAYTCWCSYEIFESADEESAMVEQGQALILNWSTGGMQLFMHHAPHLNQLIEVAIPYDSSSRWGRAVKVCETRWVRPVTVESHGHLYVVGCRRIFSVRHQLLF